MIYSGNNRLILSLFISTILLILTNCSENSGSVSGTDFNEEPGIDSVTVSIIAGNEQTGTAGHELTNPITIQVVGGDSNPVQNLRIRFDIVEGNGSVASEFNIETTDENGNAQTEWTIGPDYNAIKITPENSDIHAEPQFVYANTENPAGMAVTKSLNTLKVEGNNFYTMSFYGDYTDYVEYVNSYFLPGGSQNMNESSKQAKYHCSLFSIFGNPESYLFGRSFDNPTGWRCLTLLGEYNPPNGYKSFAFSRMQDYGYQYGTDIINLSDSEKMRLFESAGHVPDGINECGVVAGLANVQEWNFQPDPAKESIWITLLVRKILDGASNVDEAIEIAEQYNICCPDHNTLGIHVLVADASGRSVILEMYHGILRVIPNTEQWQVITNSPSYNVSIEDQKAQCTRFNNIYNSLEYSNGNISCSEGMNILQRVGWPSTEWSAMYNLTDKSIKAVIDFNFENIYEFQLVAD
ncbi:linear amide C-N hydrolase [Bacteroidota bacterium]